MADDDITVIEVSEGSLDGTTTLDYGVGYALEHPDFPDTKFFFVAGSKKIQIWIAGVMVAEWG